MQRRVALGGAVVALALTPFVPAGVQVIAAVVAVALAGRPRAAGGRRRRRRWRDRDDALGGGARGLGRLLPAQAGRAVGAGGVGGAAVGGPVVDFVPAALLAALVAVQAATSGHHLVLDGRLVGLAVAALALALRAPFIVVLVLAGRRRRARARPQPAERERAARGRAASRRGRRSRRFFAFFSRFSASSPSASSSRPSSPRMKSRVASSPTATRSEASSRARYSVSARIDAARGAVLLGLHAVAVGLPVLGQQDQRRGVGGLGGERQVEQDERVGVPAQLDRDHVQRDPDDHDDRLDGEEAAGAEEPGDALGELADRVRVRAAGSCAGRAGGPRGTSSRGASATAGPLAPVVGQQVVEHVVDAHRADQAALGVDDRGGDQVVGGEVAGDLGQRRLRAQRFEVVEDAADQRWTAVRAAAAGCARGPGSARWAWPTAAGRRTPGWPATASARARAPGPAPRRSSRRARGSPARWSSCRRRCPRST